MARINLLPWREAKRKRRQRDFIAMAATGLIATVLAALGVSFYIDQLVSAQEARNAYLQGEIRKLDRQISEIKELEKTKASLLARMNVIQQLQQSRPEVVHLFDELVVAIPDGVLLTGLKQSGKTVVVEGNAQSNARVSAFMRNIESSPWVGSPRLLLIEHKDKSGTGLSHFKLQFEQRRPEAEGEEAAS
jgi:type IV pilus assembly protein PilN